jgi:hypothetical protein
MRCGLRGSSAIRLPSLPMMKRVKKVSPALQGLRTLRPTIYVAEKMGACVGGGEVLQRSLSNAEGRPKRVTPPVQKRSQSEASRPFGSEGREEAGREEKGWCPDSARR